MAGPLYVLVSQGTYSTDTTNFDKCCLDWYTYLRSNYVAEAMSLIIAQVIDKVDQSLAT